MKPELEIIPLLQQDHSFNFFKVNEDRLEPKWHYHPELELTLINRGTGTRFVGDSIAQYYDMDLVLLGENLPHHWVSHNDGGNNPQEAAVFQFNKQTLYRLPECRQFSDLFQKANFGLQYLAPKKELLDLMLSFDEYQGIEQVSVLLKILHVLMFDENYQKLSTIDYNTKQINNRHETKISRTTKYVLENLDKSLSVEKMAQYTNLTPESFCRWFKKSFGNTFVTFLNTARVEKACQYLLQTDWNISEIAFLTGFESVGHFNRTFKKIKGRSPREFIQGFNKMSHL
ncbi:AraC family transcriptional regulator [Spongiimicrobium sp. 3-5]|uniref:AraC family transcriptional regulator n=1 Tax=Spongiimicrobium sp. 3-5 TaxID=3332596 RepID=UPI00397F40F4